MSAAATVLSVIIIVLPGPAGPGSATAAPPPVSSPSYSSPAATSGGGAGVGLDVGVGGRDVAHAGVDLAGWKLTIPEASDKGTAASVAPTDEGAKPWLTKTDNGAVSMWAPVNGETTPNSTHARTELVSANTWKAGSGGSHTLRARLAVHQVPTARQDIIVGQVHGAEDISSISFVMLHYDAGQIRVVVKQQQGSGGPTQKYLLISNVPLDSPFDYTITCARTDTDRGTGNILVTATHGNDTRTATVPIPAPFHDATVRFQAGDYQQAESRAGSVDSTSGASSGQGGEDGGRVTFYRLTETHPDNATPQRTE